MSYHIRPAFAGETPAVAALFREYASGLGVDLAYQAFEAEVRALPGAYAPPAGALLVALSPTGQAVGCVAVRKLDGPAVCEMKRLYTRSDARGLGVGRALAVAAIEAATQAGYRTMRLDTLPTMEAAQALYGDLGFEATPAYYNSPVSGTIFMRKSLLRTLAADKITPGGMD